MSRPTPRLSLELGHEIGRLASHPIREVERLEHVATMGESATTPVILVAGIATLAWTLVAVVVPAVLITAAFLTR